MEKDLIKEEISRLIADAVESLQKETSAQQVAPAKLSLEIPKDRSHGDYFTNVAMRISGSAKLKPMDAAARLLSIMVKMLPETPLRGKVSAIEVKAPGFVNFKLAGNVFCDTLLQIGAQREAFGKSDVGSSRKMLLEFVSANPTGPLTIAHARQAAFGDSLANILRACGVEIVREYYINDEGVQMSLLAQSVHARYMELLQRPSVFPENGYKGAYIYDMARTVIDTHGEKFVETKNPAKEFFLEFACEAIMSTIRRDLADFDVSFDIWYSQGELARSGKVEAALDFLRAKGYIYENEGAVWFKSTAFGDDKDRVVRKSDGSYTYLTPDIAYHRDKFARGFDRLVDIWGPDHHGYIPRMKAAIQALGHDKEALSVIIIQLATLFRDGKPVSMSTRQGEFVTLRELLDEVGKDAGRFFFVMRKSDSHLEFDLEVAKRHNAQNPVFYVQYAHARISSILEKTAPGTVTAGDLSCLVEKEEEALIKLLWEFPHCLQNCAATLEPHGLAAYAQDLAGHFHAFYDKHKVIGDDPALTKARLYLVDCTRIVLANALALLGVSAPKKM